MFETCAQPECTEEPVQGHDAIQGIQEAVDIDPETLTQEDSPNVMDLSQEESSIPELVSTSPNEDPIMYEMMQQVERAQTVLVAMSTGCPRNRYCSTVLEDIDAVLVETTVALVHRPGKCCRRADLEKQCQGCYGSVQGGQGCLRQHHERRDAQEGLEAAPNRRPD